MDIKEYQEKTKETAVYYRWFSGIRVFEVNDGNTTHNENQEIEMDWLYPVIGLAGETGELLNKLKKIIRDGANQQSKEFKQKISDEIGDIMWYVSQTCNEFGLDLEEILCKNIEKLQSRKKRGVLKGSGDNR